MANPVVEFGKALTELTREVKSLGIAAVATGSALSAIMIRSAKMFSPAEAIRFEYRLRDLSAVVGSVLHPTFMKLSDGVYKLSKWILNLSESTKRWINAIAEWIVPLGVIGLSLGGLTVVVNSVGTALGLLIKPILWLGRLIGFFAAKQAASAATAVMNVSAGVVNVMGGGISPGGFTTPTQIGPKGKPGMSIMMKGGLVAGAMGLAGTAVAGGHNFGEDLMMAGSTALTAGMMAGPLIGAIAGAASLLISSVKGWLMGTKAAPAAPGTNLDPQGMAPRAVEQMSSVLDPGRKMRMNALTTGGRPEKDASTALAEDQVAVLKAIHMAQNRMVEVWEQLQQVQNQDAQNRIAR